MRLVSPATPPESRQFRPALRLSRARAFAVLRRLALPAVLLLALALRLYGLDWDGGALYHPDERAILFKVAELRFPWDDLVLLLDAERSPWNPRWFAYGSFPLYLLRGAATVAGWVNERLAQGDLRLVGRALSGLFDTGTVFAVYLLGRQVAGRGVGLLAALLTALTVLHIQQAHFYVVDPLLTLLTTLTLLLSVVQARRPSSRGSILLGATLGLALATKASAFPLLAPVGLACAFGVVWPAERGDGSGSRADRLSRATSSLALCLLTAGAAFLIAQPYALLDFPRFWHDVSEQQGMVTRALDYPYTRQYVGTAPYLYPASQLAAWGLGWPLALAALAGVVAAAVRLWRRPTPAEALLAAWALLFFGITGAFAVKFLRYLLPLLPVLNVWAAQALVGAIRDRRWRTWSVGALVLVVAGAAAYAMAFLAIYTRPHPAVAATAWMRANAASGSTVLQEHWEEGLRGLEGFRLVELPLYEDDRPEKLRLVSERLAAADYLSFYSNRLYGTIPRLPERYPLTTAYYRLLFAGELGFTLAHVETSYPTLGPLALADDTFSRPGLPIPFGLEAMPGTLDPGYADESFTVYYHPKVLIFRRSEALTASEVESRILAAAVLVPPKTPLLSAEDAALHAASGTWRDLFPADSWAQRLPVIAWLLAVEAMALAAWPLLARLLPSWPDRGFLLAKALGPVLVAYLTWLAASLRWLAFSPVSVLMALALLVLVSLAVGWRPPFDKLRMTLRQAQGERFAQRRPRSERWRAALAGEALFLAAFGAFVVLRMFNPDLFHPYRGGEKFLDLALLNGILRSPYMPPADAWFAGGTTNYYYWGHFLVATVVRLTGIVPTLAYNLAVPWLFALTVTGAATAVSALLAARGVGPRSLIAGGLLGGLFVAVLGNLDGALQWWDGLQRLVAGETAPPFDFWRSSRMLQPSIAITEFPYFTFLFADLHAHLIALPLTLLALGLMVGLLSAWEGSWLQGLALVGLLALTCGALLAANTWDYPTYVGLGLAAIALRARWRLASQGWATAAKEGLVAAALLAGGSLLAVAPYLAHQQTFFLGFVASREQTPLLRYLAMYGLFLFASLTWLAGGALGLRAASQDQASPGRRSDGDAARPADQGGASMNIETTLLARLPVAWVALTAIATVPATWWLAQGQVLLAALWPPFVAALGVAGAIFVRFRPAAGPTVPFVVLLLAAALGLSGFLDLWTLRGDIERMNTVFKFSLQVWLLFAVVSAYSVTLLLRGFSRRWDWLRWLQLAGLVLLIGAAAVYPIAATPVRLADRFAPLPPTLDGLAYTADAVYRDERGPIPLHWDIEAMRWFQENVDGSPVIAEGQMPLYRWGARYSVHLGLPTILGWDWHETQQRPGAASLVEERKRDIAALYASPDPAVARQVLQRYNVRYVVVGPVERLYYPATGLAKFATMAELRVACENEGVTVWEVR
ncbi:MAG TPA: DUF2298 domain-containing protein [Dehalococcoidia bacterium]|nr:DUF2298 domain-containing protein [Dehalococcoidia bacterium]